MEAHYVFAATVRFAPEHGRVDPQKIEVQYRHPAPAPGDDGWLFFRNHCWRGEVNDPEGVRRLIADDLGVDVEHVELRGFETDEQYLTALKDEIGANLELFNADSTTEVLHKYLASKLEVGLA